MNAIKPWQSKTILLNALMGVCAALVVFVPGLGHVSAWVQGHADMIGMVWAGLNVVLRFVTKDKISLVD